MTHVNPDDVRLVTSDICNFWRAYDMSEGKATEEKIEIYEKEYLAKGSIGLEDFVNSRIKSAEELVKAIEARPKYYASIRESSNRVPEMTDRIRNYMHIWKNLYDEAVFQDVYFVIGRMTSAGTTSRNGLLIGTEILCRTDDSPVEELPPVYINLIRPIEYLPYVVIHELIHPQQKYDFEGNTLLGHSIMEGAADFLGELASGGFLNQLQHEYGQVHETELWEDFSKEMLQDNFSNWLYNYFENLGDRPPDMGYYIGYRICESYYEKMDDKHQAIRDILAIKDGPDALRFLQESGYGQ
ncbi:MAG: DUF2268 domain-containing putative Zn-dependent protease [Gemmatimonadetes bacterium]|nr:DUF2268 domain-containing putative Zn-dependent protease [Gemmatimonadota bacterium]